MLCDYFRQFGAIERVQILPERVRFNDSIPIFGANSSVDNFRNGRKYFAYVTFVNCLGACEALNNKDNHVIQNHRLNIEQAFSWHQPGGDNRDQPEFSDRDKKLYEDIDRALNNDCIIDIMSYLNIFELCHIAGYNQRFLSCAQLQRKLKIIPTNIMVEGITIMGLRRILRLVGFGQTATCLTVSARAFRSQKTHVFDRLVQYIGPQLTSLSLRHFNITSDEFVQLRPLLQQLTYLELDLNYEFDYEKFNDKWPKLETLRLRTAGLINFIKDSSKIEFPKLTSLQLITSYKLNENLFDTIANNFNGLRELVIIMLDDYYSELTQVPTDFQNLNKLQQLTKLHLSIIRKYFDESILETIAEITSIEQLTLDVTNYRSPNPDPVLVSDRSLAHLARSLPNLIVFRLSGLQMSGTKVIQIVQHACHLIQFGLHNCNYKLNVRLINDIVNIRRRLQGNRVTLSHGTFALSTQLELTVDQCTDIGEKKLIDYELYEVILILFYNILSFEDKT